MKRTIATLGLSVMLVACATQPGPDAIIAKVDKEATQPLNQLAEHYVQLQLAIGQHEDGYIDAYYGPAQWAEAVKAEKVDLGTLSTQLSAISAVLSASRSARSSESQRRSDFLYAQIKAASTRIDMLRGKELSFADEAEGLFGVRPQLKPLSSYDPILDQIEAIVPDGPGTLAERVDAFRDRTVIPKDRLKPVFDAAIAECKARTAAHIALPPGESFDLEFVTGKSWSGYNWYKGDYHSLIQVNTDLPIRISRAVDLGCHEGYPGHHALNMLLEQQLTRGKGWVEYSIYPLYSPQSLIAEGSANYGIRLAFSDVDRLKFEREVLYPLAGLDPDMAAAQVALDAATQALSGARLTIAQLYLDGKISRAEAVQLAQKYQLISAARAEQSISFTDQYRSYVINYGLGQEMVRDYVERGNPDEQTRWARMERVISEPTLPRDLTTD